MTAWIRACACALVMLACDNTLPSSDGGTAERPEILELRAPDPAVEGSLVEVRGLGFDDLGSDPRLSVDSGGSSAGVLFGMPDDVDGRLLFELTGEVVSALGSGDHTVTVRLMGNGLSSDPYIADMSVRTALPVDLFEVPRGEAHRNDVAVVVGAGIVGPTEGELTARFEGTYTFDAGGDRPVAVSLPVAPLERFDRERGVIVLTTDIGALAPGTFDGTVTLESRLVSGERSESAPQSTSLHFNPPELFSLDPPNGHLGQLLSVRGAGFLGGPDRPDETTLIRLSGRFVPEGGSPEPFSGEIVPEFVSGDEVLFFIEPEVRSDALVASLFGHARGAFEGTATPITIDGTEELEGSTIPFRFELVGARQVVFVRFLPGFYDSLRRFGLHRVADEVEMVVQDRMTEIYGDWAVEIRFEEPEDQSRVAYSILEVGGPDPNGVGLFGYDNTPGKDVGNLRLFDAIGGANAETQMDGYPGYGGVFVESFLYWSENPGLGAERPPGSPDPDPLFDEVFAEVRARPATRSEGVGDGDPDRVAAVRRAIDALGSIVGETSSHELGHSLGMAQPFGPPTVYHNDFDGDGCLMDSGGDRPLGERMDLPGFSRTHFCYDHPSYLDEIL
ncbi:MAG: hypothetical protein RLO52_04540 [Sandaracinaceae bacterium]